MRTIKFRAWDKKNNGFNFMDLREAIGCDDAYALCGNQKDCSFNCNCEIQQFTGLFDKNGKEIYEGDIMRQSGVGNCEVIFINGTFGLALGVEFTAFCEDYEEDFEIVIGNIWENPELLEGKKQ